ncbi:hypothetical protein Hypma_001178 [Hypsizygus marmoreus]|uniref:MYND-type domain-containing protein n=1 Tax=Hypsizygus marmoreus TaxID=39966 RepID=A0A369JDC0_HYPMA|nr:hypothetical protein Hypma_001178 [Hypsizygus marmoreus]
MSFPTPNTVGRTVHVPPQQYKCSQCGKTTDLRFCVCREVMYCSVECQKIHWKSTHKPFCTGAPDLIDIASIYPLLALIADFFHQGPTKPAHPALNHTIINSPNPIPAPDLLPDGYKARLVVLGDPVPQEEVVQHPEVWWPKPWLPDVRKKLLGRILREGYLLPIMTALCVALIAEIYTTTDEPNAPNSMSGPPSRSPRRRLRLKYKTSPVSDFGIAKGKILTPDHRKLAYYIPAQDRWLKGQDPDDHYWLYFTTLKGEEVILDYGVYTFDLGMFVDTAAYQNEHLPPLPVAPGYFGDRQQNNQMERLSKSFQMHRPTQRFSFLRDKALHSKLARGIDSLSDAQNVRALWGLMDRIAGRGCTAVEKDLAVKWANVACLEMWVVVNDPKQPWTKWPEVPRTMLEPNHEEFDKDGNWGFPSDRDDVAWRPLDKLFKKYNRGEISLGAFGKGYMEWSAKRSPEGIIKLDFEK